MKVGVLGGGQLAQMMAQAGAPLKMQFMFLCPNEDACAAPFGHHLCAAYDDENAHRQLAEWADVITYEFENVPLAAVKWLEERVAVFPSSLALAAASDRLHEKRRFRALDIPTAQFAAVDSQADLSEAAARIGLPAILKTRTEGYDGKGQAVLRETKDLEGAWERVGARPCILESMVPFEREVSIIAARGRDGAVVFYPLSENHHREGILRLSLSRPGDPMQGPAEQAIRRLLEDLDYVGVLALELFQVGDQLLANEMAPRVHNTGHWTIEGARTSQFENHLRAVCGLPLGETAIAAPSAMVNLIGRLPAEADIRAVSGAVPHFYGKAERPGRKVGHITLTRDGSTPEDFRERLKALLRLAGETELAEANLAI
ncbi:5-(carboxyamino)imidazole ribonucleotide synthase [Gilvimarinus sp. F26214L]|uniref:5-(carboxyamino)imidazole ribonucleotide synthase n=1 Tax=Gilvimarinus sp. DZF01 TaxID=3461371 RepID=UPI0040461FCB